ncbi:MAG: hypothetical protein KTR30_10925 [Saprospiraceae bacterium]|nr:hypothetical protein [Saprospiraceae bacterium]
MKIKFSSQQLGVAILFIGIVLRLIVFGQNRSLFIDEANLARNIVEKGFSSFFQILDYDQYAPPLFLCISKCFTLLMGANEWALRAWPLLAGTLSLWLVLRISQQLQLTGLAYLIPISWMSFSTLFVRYHTEVKQYSSDAMVALLLVFLLLRTRLHKQENNSAAVLSTRFYLSWGVVGCCAPWFSMYSVFVLFGIGVFVALKCWREGSIRRLLFWGLTLCSWLLSFGIYYLLILRFDLGKDALIDYHSQFSFPTNWLKASAWQQAGGVLQSILRSTFGFTFLAYLLGGLGLVIGLVHLYRRAGYLLIILGLPILTAWVASAFGLYSLIPRLTLFFLPLLYLIFAYSFQGLDRRSFSIRGKRLSFRYLLLIPIALLLPLQKGPEYLWAPLKIEELRPVLVQLNPMIEAPTPIYVNHEAEPAFAFYQALHEFHPYVNQVQSYRAKWDEYPAAWLETLPIDKSEVWLLYSHLISDYATGRMQADLQGIPKTWEVGHQLEAEGVIAIQYLRKND